MCFRGKLLSCPSLSRLDPSSRLVNPLPTNAPNPSSLSASSLFRISFLPWLCQSRPFTCSVCSSSPQIHLVASRVQPFYSLAFRPPTSEKISPPPSFNDKPPSLPNPVSAFPTQTKLTISLLDVYSLLSLDFPPLFLSLPLPLPPSSLSLRLHSRLTLIFPLLPLSLP